MGSGGGGSSFVAPQVTNVTETPGGGPSSSDNTTPANGSVTVGFAPTAPAACAVVASARFTG